MRINSRNTAKHYMLHLTYFTRPLWEKPEKPFNMITHYYAPGVELCELHNWKERKSDAKVYDAILFSVELDLLEIRLHELYPVVEKFIIIESNSTFTGLPKPLHFELNKERFNFAIDKIVYKAIEAPPLKPGEDPFKMEEFHRVSMNELIVSAGVKVDDWVLMLDVDEIPSANTVQLFKRCDGIPDIIHLQLRNYIYSFEFMLDMNSWRGKAVKYTPVTGYSHSRKSDFMLADAGWHCSFCFSTIKDFEFKMTGYSHSDRVHYDYILDPERIQKVICDGSDIFDMLPEMGQVAQADLSDRVTKVPAREPKKIFHEFESLGVTDFNSLFTQDSSNSLFKELEIGEIQPQEFYDRFRAECQLDITDVQIRDAWNAMLGDWFIDQLEYCEKLPYRIFLFSNTNVIHHDFFINSLSKRKVLQNVFEKVYYSHTFGHRKPDLDSYQQILKENGLDPEETLFIDDSLQNVEAASKVGIHGIHLKPPEKVSLLFQ
ncbi:hypothetical protein HDV06_001857 [Boothiomyces sp. JEL0866]|nr:hypothetical protein HDV06_001857 [Boothiomyces sp. JEL0866]